MNPRSFLVRVVICWGIPGALSVLTFHQIAMYRNLETLWRTTVAQSPQSGMAHNNLGMFLLQTGGVNEAMYYLERAITLSPQNAEAHSNFGYALQLKGRLPEAIEQFKKAAELRPGFAIYDANLGNALAQIGRWREAIQRYESAVGKSPSDPNIVSNLAWLLATSRDATVRNGPKAVVLAEQAVQFSGDDPQLLATLGAAYAADRRFDQAIATGEKSRLLAIARGNKRLAELNTQLLERYRSQQDFPSDP